MRTSYMRAARPPLVSRTRMRTRSESTARFAASAFDWRERFGRKPKEGARPLLILWPFGPVALVYDLMDTDGRDLPRDVWSFYARGCIDSQKVNSFAERLKRKNIEWLWVDAGDQ